MSTWTAGTPDLPTGWATKGGIADGEITDGGGYMVLDTATNGAGVSTNAFDIVEGTWYRVTGSFTKIGGNNVQIGESPNVGFTGANITTTTTNYSETFLATDTQSTVLDIIGHAVVGQTEWNIDNVSIKEVSGNHGVITGATHNASVPA